MNGWMVTSCLMIHAFPLRDDLSRPTRPDADTRWQDGPYVAQPTSAQGEVHPEPTLQVIIAPNYWYGQNEKGHDRRLFVLGFPCLDEGAMIRCVASCSPVKEISIVNIQHLIYNKFIM